MEKLPSFVAIDLETTGLDFENDEIIEIALVRFDDGRPGESVDFLLKPEKALLRPFIENLTGISNEDISSAESFADVAHHVCNFIGDMPLVAHNAMFDSRFLKQTMQKVGISFEGHPVWDSLTLSRIAYQDVPNHRLETLVQELGIERSRAHRALPDADACGKLFVLAYEKIRRMDSWLLDSLARIAEGSDWERIFGATEQKDATGFKFSLQSADSPFAPSERAKTPRVDAFFGSEGILSKSIENYGERENQKEFASIVERNMHKGGLCVIEAPTGSGKSLAYLVAAANKAVSGERVLISTATRTLEDQLFTHDIPQISAIYDGKLKAAVLKGRDNYLCVRKFKELLESPATLILPEERDSFMALLPWASSTESGDIGACGSFSVGRNRTLWSKVSSNASSCMGEKCPFNAICPALGAKRRAMQSNLLLVNHSLFLADLSLDFALLPAYEHVVFDEAHRLPASSNASFGKTVSFFGFRNIAKTLVPQKGVDSGIIEKIKNTSLENDAVCNECEQLIVDLSETEKALHRFFMKIGKKLLKMKTGKSGFAYTKGILPEYDVDPKPIFDQFEIAKSRCSSLVHLVDGLASVAGIVKDLEGRMSELSRFISDLEFLVKASREDWVFYLEEPFNPHTLKMHAFPLHGGEIWNSKFYPWIKSATFTSATLAVQGDLGYFASRMGMNLSTNDKRPFLKVFNERPETLERRSVMVAKYLPKPSDATFGEALNDALCQSLVNLDENSMVLFTSVSSMMKAQERLSKVFAARGKLLLCQHVDGSLDGLLSMFRKSRGACLLGCQSLWEGVDLPGDALKVLVIAKLPFPNPSDPFVAALSSDMKGRGENVFKNYYVPEAYMELRQGLGRLLRTESDSGKVLLLDNRIVNEPYGKTFARIWNMKQEVAANIDEVVSFLCK